MNVGATSLNQPGLKFRWGETTEIPDEDTTISADGYIWTNDGGKTFTKYNSTDGKTVLDLEDDAAHMNMGGSWRMPTDEDFTELFTHTDHDSTV